MHAHRPVVEVIHKICSMGADRTENVLTVALSKMQSAELCALNQIVLEW